MADGAQSGSKRADWADMAEARGCAAPESAPAWAAWSERRMRPKRPPPCLCAPTRPTGDAEHVSWYNDHLRALHCSEMMLTPKTILKGRWYVDGIAAWVKDRRRRGGETCPQDERRRDGGREAGA